MKSLAELVLSLCDLCEAEGRVLRENVRNIGLGCAIAGIGLLFVAAAMALVAISIFEGLLAILPLPACLLILAVVCMLIAGGFFLASKKWLIPKTHK